MSQQRVIVGDDPVKSYSLLSTFEKKISLYFHYLIKFLTWPFAVDLRGLSQHYSSTRGQDRPIESDDDLKYLKAKK